MVLVQTPIEEYIVNGRLVHVKRDDLVGDGVNFPRWAKIEGIRRILESDSIDKNKPLVHLSVYGSWTGWVLSRLCKEYGIEFISAYPDSKTYPPEILEIIKSNGAKLHPMKPNMMKLLENKLRGEAKKNGWQMLPYAFNHPEYVNYMQLRMREVLEKEDYDHLVVSMGSAVTASGLIREFLQYDSWKDILKNKRQVHTVTMSSIESTKDILNHNKAGDINNIHIHKSPYSFDDMMDDVMEWPFDLNEFWERKMWFWLTENISTLEGKILFWNIGGSYKKSLNLK
jgi:cysteine synthase